MQSRPPSRVRHQVAEVEILVNGTPQKRYAHEGRWYVEAVKGREYAIRVRNPYPVRAGVALSVDGLNTIDARHTAAANARKWVLEPYETITISGWQTSRTDARRFEFTTEEQSYGKALGETANLGVISAVFFKERVSAIARESAKETERRHAPAAPAPQLRAAGRQGKALPTPIVSKGWTSRSTPRPGWAAAPITRLPKCGWISKKRPRRR